MQKRTKLDIDAQNFGSWRWVRDWSWFGKTFLMAVSAPGPLGLSVHSSY